MCEFRIWDKYLITLNPLCENTSDAHLKITVQQGSQAALPGFVSPAGAITHKFVNVRSTRPLHSHGSKQSLQRDGACPGGNGSTLRYGDLRIRMEMSKTTKGATRMENHLNPSSGRARQMQHSNSSTDDASSHPRHVRLFLT